MYKEFSEEFADDIRNMMKHFGLPYIEIKIYNESPEDELRSPVKHISLKMEALVNALLGDMMFAGMDEAGYILNHFVNQIDDLMTFSSYLRMKHEKLRLNNVLKAKLTEVMEQYKHSKVSPIPKVFEDALKDIQVKNKKSGEKDNKDGKGKN